MSLQNNSVNTVVEAIIKLGKGLDIFYEKEFYTIAESIVEKHAEFVAVEKIDSVDDYVSDKQEQLDYLEDEINDLKLQLINKATPEAFRNTFKEITFKYKILTLVNNLTN